MMHFVSEGANIFLALFNILFGIMSIPDALPLFSFPDLSNISVGLSSLNLDLSPFLLQKCNLAKTWMAEEYH